MSVSCKPPKIPHGMPWGRPYPQKDQEVEGVHPGRLTWNQRIHPWKRKIIFQTIIFRFYVNLWGCNWLTACHGTMVADKDEINELKKIIPKTKAKMLNKRSNLRCRGQDFRERPMGGRSLAGWDTPKKKLGCTTHFKKVKIIFQIKLSATC